MPYVIPILFERDDGRARAALRDVGELEALDIPVAPEVLVDALPEGSRALAVDDQDLREARHDGVVEELADYNLGLVDHHAADVDLAADRLGLLHEGRGLTSGG